MPTFNLVARENLLLLPIEPIRLFYLAAGPLRRFFLGYRTLLVLVAEHAAWLLRFTVMLVTGLQPQR
jgi:hypothetical protein